MSPLILKQLMKQQINWNCWTYPNLFFFPKKVLITLVCKRTVQTKRQRPLILNIFFSLIQRDQKYYGRLLKGWCTWKDELSYITAVGSLHRAKLSNLKKPSKARLTHKKSTSLGTGSIAWMLYSFVVLFCKIPPSLLVSLGSVQNRVSNASLLWFVRNK